MAITRRTALASPFLFLPGRAAQPRPNIVWFMTDDHGAWALGAYGCKEMHTPNLDRLAAEGVRFTRAYACTPVCSPSRMTYVTGKIPSRHGVHDWLRPVDSFGAKSRYWLEGHETVAEVLGRNGYTCGMTGKWHMGHDDTPAKGYSYWATVPGGGGTYRNPEFVKNGVRQRINEFKTDAVGDCAIEFLSMQKKDSPFFLHVPFYAPHTPYDFQPAGDRKHYDDAPFSCFPDDPMHPWQNAGLKRHWRDRESKHSYSALVSAVDRNVGRVLDKVREMGARENTVVIFTADQGYNTGHHGVWGKGNGTHPFNMYEESIRVPMIWNHPGHLRPAAPDAMISSYDFFPTILDYAGVKAKPDAARVGRSYAPLLRGARIAPRNRLYFEYANVRAVRTENQKYIARTGENWPSELFDLEADPGEKNNVLEDPRYAAARRSLSADLKNWFERAGAPALENWRGSAKQELTVYSR